MIIFIQIPLKLLIRQFVSLLVLAVVLVCGLNRIIGQMHEDIVMIFHAVDEGARAKIAL